MRIPKLLLLNAVLVFYCFLPLSAQNNASNTGQLGLQVTLNAAFGTHFQRIGINLNLYFTQGVFQSNSEMRVYYNFKSLGPKVKHAEFILAQGILFGYGKQDSVFNPFISSVSNQTSYLHSIGYTYNAYFNKRRSTQQTGTLVFQFNSISFITENDLLARPALDRFRTAAFLIQYQHHTDFQAAINCTMWTGKMGYKHTSDRPEIRSACYMDTVGGVYTSTSHGLLSAQLKYNTGYSQNLQANAGIDAEQIRNAVQNKFIHDMPFLPKKWHKGKNCHIPMLDEKGNPYLYEEDQKIRKAKLFLNAFTNANVFY